MVSFSALNLYNQGILSNADMIALDTTFQNGQRAFGNGQYSLLKDVYCCRASSKGAKSLLKPASWLAAICLALKCVKK